MKNFTLIFVFLLLQLQFFRSSAEQSRPVCSRPVIEAVEGDDVFLPCHVEPLVDLSAYTVDWKRVDLNKVVFCYRNGRVDRHPQLERYRERVTVNLDYLSRGNLTLKLHSAQLDDGGSYKCFVPKLKSSCIVQVKVTKDEGHGNGRDGFNATANPLDEQPEAPASGARRNIRDHVILLLIPAGFFIIVSVACCWRAVCHQNRKKEQPEGLQFEGLDLEGQQGNEEVENDQRL